MAIIKLLVMMVTGHPSWAASPQLPGATRYWADIGLGVGSMQTGSGPPGNHGAGPSLDAQLGSRIDRHWLAGFNLGGIGLHPSNDNYDPTKPYSSSIYGQSITHVLAVLQFQPGDNRGWFTGAGVGRVYYDNKALQALTGYLRSGSGPAVMGRVGYDWPLRSRLHLEAVLSVEGGSISLKAPFTDRFHFSIATATLHVAYH